MIFEEQPMMQSEPPRSLAQAVERLLAKLPAEEQEKLRSTKEDDLIDLHFSLGMGIRNAFPIWGNEALLRSCAIERRSRIVAEMSLGGVVLLTGIALWHRSAFGLGLAAVVFLVARLVVVYLEEPGLEKRFGDSYREYRRNVRRWVPRITPWQRSSAAQAAADRPRD